MTAIRLPEPGRCCFDQLPATVERLLTGTTSGRALDEPLLRERFDRVALVYLDAFGWWFVERLWSHPLLARARAEGLVLQLTSQFPSTTTAHVTTIASGLPVAEHGLYEWHVLEPSLDRLITPLLFSFAGDRERDTLAGLLDPEGLFPAGALAARLAAAGVRPIAVQPPEIARSTPSRVLFRDADSLPADSTESALDAAAVALTGTERVYAYVYLPHVDSLMHEIGPDDPSVDAAFAAALDAVAAASFPPGTLVLLTSDHGMSPIDPARTAYVNELWPGLGACLLHGADGKPLAPAGSCRDLFLHVRDGELRHVQSELAERLAGIADVVTTAALIETGAFAAPSERLRARLGNLVVLPYEGEAALWHEPERFVQRFRGQHGGLTPREMEIPLVAWVA